MPLPQRLDRISGHYCNRRNFRQASPVWSAKLQGTVGLSRELEAFLVDRAVMAATQQREIRERGRSTFRPVTDVMTFAESYLTAWKATAAISVVQRTP